MRVPTAIVRTNSSGSARSTSASACPAIGTTVFDAHRSVADPVRPALAISAARGRAFSPHADDPAAAPLMPALRTRFIVSSRPGTACVVTIERKSGPEVQVVMVIIQARLLSALACPGRSMPHRHAGSIPSSLTPFDQLDHVGQPLSSLDRARPRPKSASRRPAGPCWRPAVRARRHQRFTATPGAVVRVLGQ